MDPTLWLYLALVAAVAAIALAYFFANQVNQANPGNDRMVEIERVLQGGPLDPGTLVVVSNNLTLSDKAKVRVKSVEEPVLFLAQAPGQEQ